MEQVAKEREAGVPITTFMDVSVVGLLLDPMMLFDRVSDQSNLFNSQINDDVQLASVNFGFVAYVVLPLWKALAAHFAVYEEFLQNGEDNRCRWEAVRDELCTLERAGELVIKNAKRSVSASARRTSAMSKASSESTQSQGSSTKGRGGDEEKVNSKDSIRSSTKGRGDDEEKVTSKDSIRSR